MKWYTQSEYVDRETGEKITKKQAETEYIIIKKNKYNERKQQWRKLPNGTSLREEYGLTTITNICTRDGKQIKLW